MTRLRYLQILFFFLILQACDPEMVYDHFVTMDNGMWTWSDVGEFQIPVSDTVSLHNIYIQVRHSVDYPMSNLYMFVVLKGPSGQFARDTVDLQLAAPDGRWFGKGIGRLRELRLLYRKQVRFSEPGTYTIYLEQAMRKQALPVRDVGIRVERVNPGKSGKG